MTCNTEEQKLNVEVQRFIKKIIKKSKLKAKQDIVAAGGKGEKRPKSTIRLQF